MYEKQIEIVNGVRRALPKFEHYSSFSKRCLTFIQTELPGYRCLIKAEDNWSKTGKYFKIEVWGNGLTFDEGMSIYFEDSNLPWQTALSEALDRHDPSSSKERYEQEQTLIPALDNLNKELVSIRERAQQLITNLPVPKSEKIRKDPDLWTTPSYELTKQFPLLFK